MVKNKFRLYISGQLIGDYASAAGVWARLGQRPFGATFMVYDLAGENVGEFMIF
jgi:hypothetical protein